MKYFILLLAAAFTFSSCEGPQGPPGFDGLDGSIEAAQSFERTIDFTAPDYAQLIVYPNTVQTLPSDMTLVYRLEDEVAGNNGGTVDVWSLLPQIFYTNQGEFQYNYNATSGDVELFLDAPDRNTLDVIDAGFVNNQTFRIVILPVDLFASNPALDITDYNAVMNAAALSVSDIQVIE